jgi:hypothetical protein
MSIIRLKDLGTQNSVTGAALKHFESWLESQGIKPVHTVQHGRGSYALYKEDEVAPKMAEWLYLREHGANKADEHELATRAVNMMADGHALTMQAVAMISDVVRSQNEILQKVNLLLALQQPAGISGALRGAAAQCADATLSQQNTVQDAEERN